MGRWKLHVAVLSLYTEICRSSTRLLQPHTVFLGFAVAPRIPLTAPVSGVQESWRSAEQNEVFYTLSLQRKPPNSDTRLPGEQMLKSNYAWAVPQQDKNQRVRWVL